MAISLQKNKSIFHTQHNNGLEFISVILSWDERKTFGKEFDLDISCFLLDKSGKAACETDFIFYNNPVSACGSVKLSCDNTSGVTTENKEEILNIDFPRLPESIEKVVIAASIHDSQNNGQLFGIVDNARVDIINRANNRRLAFFQLSEAFMAEAAVIVCEFGRAGSGWKFRALEGSNAASLADIVKEYGLAVE